jgi:hypothetical protein
MKRTDQQTVCIDRCVKLRLDQRKTRSAKIRGVRQGCLSPILFSVYSKYLNKETLERFGVFRIGQVIHTVKYADDLVLLAKK